MNLKEVCRLLLTTDFSNREVARAADIAPNTAGRYRTRLLEEGLDWNGVAALTDRALEERLNNGRQLARKAFVEPDFAHVHAELHRTGVTVLLLHEEYAGAAGDGAMSRWVSPRRLFPCGACRTHASDVHAAMAPLSHRDDRVRPRQPHSGGAPTAAPHRATIPDPAPPARDVQRVGRAVHRPDPYI